MKPNRISFRLLACITFLLFFFSCQEESTTTPQPPAIIGTWSLTNPFTVRIKFKVNTNDYDGSSYYRYALPITWAFKENGEATYTDSYKATTDYSYALTTINEQKLVTLTNKKTLKQELYLWETTGNGNVLQLVTKNYLDLFPDKLVAGKFWAGALGVSGNPIANAEKMTSIQDLILTFSYTKQ